MSTGQAARDEVMLAAADMSETLLSMAAAGHTDVGEVLVEVMRGQMALRAIDRLEERIAALEG